MKKIDLFIKNNLNLAFNIIKETYGSPSSIAYDDLKLSNCYFGEKEAKIHLISPDSEKCYFQDKKTGKLYSSICSIISENPDKEMNLLKNKNISFDNLTKIENKSLEIITSQIVFRTSKENIKFFKSSEFLENLVENFDMEDSYAI